MFNSCTGFEMQPLYIVLKIEYKKKFSTTRKKTRKLKEHCVQNFPFQGSYKYKRNLIIIQGNQGNQVRVGNP